MNIRVVEKDKKFGIETLDKSPSVLAFAVKGYRYWHPSGETKYYL